jgi:5,5'-dehydrodivanillate O-demethylase oxygenase subunit
MLTREQNERLTKVGPGTPCGELLRRYWHVLCPVGELLGSQRKQRVRMLGEDLVVYRKDDGSFVAGSGRETLYPVQQLSGLLFVYMGPNPENAPLLPRWDVLADTERPKKILVMPVHTCNWLQIQENTVDTVHTYYLHGHMSEIEKLPTLEISPFFYRPIESYDYAVGKWGIEKSVVYGGNKPEAVTFPPMLFPNILRITEGPVDSLHFRVPVDDEHTRIIWIGLLPQSVGAVCRDEEIPYTIEFDPPGVRVEDVSLDTFYGQDRIVWETQGRIADRTRETLGASDRGIVLFRRMLDEQIRRVEHGDEPDVAVFRDPESNRVLDFDYITKSWILDEPVPVS